MANTSRTTKMSAIAGALSRVGDVNASPLVEALDYINSLIDDIENLEEANERLRSDRNFLEEEIEMCPAISWHTRDQNGV